MHSKKWCLTQILLCTFFCNSAFIPSWFLISSTSMKKPTSVSEITILYLHENIIIPLLCQCGCVGQIKNSGNSEFFFRDFYIRVFHFGCRSKIRNKKTRNNISEISEISEVSELLICHFFIFFLNFFSFLETFFQDLYFTFVTIQFCIL